MSKDRNGPGDPSRRERLAGQVRGWLHRLAVEGFDTETVWVPIGAPGMSSDMGSAMTRATVADPLCGVRAVVLARAVADRMLVEYAEDARGAGRMWDEIADALGLDEDDPTRPGDVGRAERAFEQIAGESTYRWTARSRWTCAACGARVNDYGPYESHPNDREDGHTDQCPRQRAALAAWRAETDDTEDTDGGTDSRTEGGDW